jgi:phage-related protein
MRVIKFYQNEEGNSPVIDFLNDLPPKTAQKVTWVLKLIEDHDIIPKTYYKKLTNTDDIWETRIQTGNNIYRILCFQHKNKVVILTNGFQKKSQKTPKSEIDLAERRKEDWLRREK